jgi:hypothetical protein
MQGRAHAFCCTRAGARNVEEFKILIVAECTGCKASAWKLIRTSRCRGSPLVGVHGQVGVPQGAGSARPALLGK